MKGTLILEGAILHFHDYGRKGSYQDSWNVSRGFVAVAEVAEMYF